MARFVKQKSDIASALDNLGALAQNFISMETNRRIQLGREKESRMVEAYQYMLNNEDAQINELENALDTIEQNFLDKGIQLKSVNEEYRTIASEELLAAANEGAMELVSAKLNESEDYKSRLENRKRDASKVLRHINLFDDAMSLVDPATSGDPALVEAGDVADAAIKFMEGHDKYAPEIEQRLKVLQTEGELQRLQTDYYARLKEESEQKILAATAGSIDATTTIRALEPVKKQTQEAVDALTFEPLSKMREQYGIVITRGAELLEGKNRMTGEDLSKTEINEKETEKSQQLRKLGTMLFPWITDEAQAEVAAEGMQMVMVKAAGRPRTSISPAVPPSYNAFINYLKQGNAQYQLMDPASAQLYRNDLQDMLGIDIADDAWIEQLINLDSLSSRVDIEQGLQATKIGMSLLPEVPIERSEEDELLNRFLQGGK
jgi:hypothetical protein